jgi:hypothetical protein
VNFSVHEAMLKGLRFGHDGQLAADASVFAGTGLGISAWSRKSGGHESSFAE